MPTPHKVILAVDTSLREDQLKRMSDLSFLKESDVTLVHIVQNQDYGDGVYFNVTFSDDVDKTKITHAVIDKLKHISACILPPGHSGKVNYECLYSEDIRNAFCRYVVNEKADLAVVASFEHHHIFDVSFGDYASKKSVSITNSQI